MKNWRYRTEFKYLREDTRVKTFAKKQPNLKSKRGTISIVYRKIPDMPSGPIDLYGKIVVKFGNRRRDINIVYMRARIY